MSADVSNQAHYAHGIEPIDYMRSRFTREEFRGFLTGNVLKYVSRFQDKDGVRDLEKARVYLDWLIAAERDAGSGTFADHDPRQEGAAPDWNDLQRRVAEWARQASPHGDIDAACGKMSDELVEVANDPIDRSEWADVLLVLMHAALDNGHTMADLHAACERKFATVQKRQWGEPDERGVVRHVGDFTESVG